MDPIARRTGGLLDRLERLGHASRRLTRGGVNPLAVRIDDISSPVEGVIEGRPTLLFGTNSYLGLNFHPACVAAAGEALRRHGTGSTASRVASGNHAGHEALEAEIAAFYGRPDAIVFSTGFLANLGVITALAGPGDAVFLDAHCHASIVDAARLSGAEVRVFAHNDAADLDARFADSKVPPAATLVVVEGLYSVWGDVADLPAIVACAKRHGAVMLVDEAHSLGTLGATGRGAAEAAGVEADVDVIVGTFSKSVGVIGGFCVTGAPALRLKCRAYLFTASLPPAVVAAARAAFSILASPEGAALRARLWHNVQFLHAGLLAIACPPVAPPGPVGSLRRPTAEGALATWRALLAKGVYVNLLIPPATPQGEAVLRFSLSAAHTESQISSALAAFKEELK